MDDKKRRKSLFFQIKTHEQLSKIFFRANNTEKRKRDTSKSSRMKFAFIYIPTMYCDVNFFRQTNSSEKNDFVMSDNEHAAISSLVT